MAPPAPTPPPAPLPAAVPGSVRTVFLGDSYIASYGIAPVDERQLPCVRARENLPDVIEDQLADQSILLDIRADVSCAGAQLKHVWEPQDLGGDMSARPQKEALSKETELVVVGLGANTLGVPRILKQCSARMRGTEGALSFLDKKVQVPLNDLMATKAKANGAHFVDLYRFSGGMTACDGKERAIGALLEKSAVTLLHQNLPWFLHGTETGRGEQGNAVAQDIAKLYGKKGDLSRGGTRRW